MCINSKGLDLKCPEMQRFVDPTPLSICYIYARYLIHHYAISASMCSALLYVSISDKCVVVGVNRSQSVIGRHSFWASTDSTGTALHRTDSWDCSATIQIHSERRK